MSWSRQKPFRKPPSLKVAREQGGCKGGKPWARKAWMGNPKHEGKFGK